MTVIGIDPAKRTGYAYRDDTGEWCSGTVDPDDREALRRILQSAMKCGCTVAAIEDCYLDKNAATFKKLAVIQGRIIAECISVGLKYKTINPTKWKRAMLTTGGWFPKRRQDQKTLARWVAIHLFHATPKNYDEADAICICEYATRTPLELELGENE